MTTLIHEGPWEYFQGGICFGKPEERLQLISFEGSRATMGDARLMAAAPDLLKALHAAVLEGGHSDECPKADFDKSHEVECECWYQKAWNAINRANGKE